MKFDVSQSPSLFELARERTGEFFHYERGDRVVTAIHEGHPIAQALYSVVDPGVKCELSLWAYPGNGFILGRRFLRQVFEIPFTQWHCKRVTAITHLSNSCVTDQLIRLGFAVEAPLADWYADGDGLMFCMLRRDCRWLPS